MSDKQALSSTSTHAESSQHAAAGASGRLADADSPRQMAQEAQIAQLQQAESDVDAPAQKPAQGGLPEGMRSGIEALSGMDMSGVRVHRNSGKPAQLNAHAYAQGNDIHLGPGQEKHLPHEAWHVVQQRQGRVKPTVQRAGISVNDNLALEREASLMGGRSIAAEPPRLRDSKVQGLTEKSIASEVVVQAVWKQVGDTENYYWQGRNSSSRSPCPGIEVPDPTLADYDDRAGELPRQGGGGFLAAGGANQITEINGVKKLRKGCDFDTNSATATSSYYGGAVKIHHSGGDVKSKGPGAMFPLPEVINPLPNRPRVDSGWLQTGERQTKRRRPELTIMGQSASAAAANSSLQPRPLMAQAHIQPDHSMPVIREDRDNRHPATESSNMQHTAVEKGIALHIEKHGPTPVFRHLYGESHPGSGLHAGMEMTVGLVMKDGLATVSTDAPFFSEEPGRQGDSVAIARYLELEYYKNLTRDAGLGDELGDYQDSSDESSDSESEYEEGTLLAPLGGLSQSSSASPPGLNSFASSSLNSSSLTIHSPMESPLSLPSSLSHQTETSRNHKRIREAAKDEDGGS
jgi:hypothetical protein